MTAVSISMLAALLLFAQLLPWSTAERTLLPEVAPENLPFLDNSHEDEVLVLKQPPHGYEPASTDADWEPFFRANLFRDLGPYKRKVVKAGHPLNLTGLVYQLKLLRSTRRWRNVVFVLVRQNIIYRYLPGGDPDIKTRALRNLETLAVGASRLGLKLPDTVFVYNMYDEPICRAAGRCVVPVFSMHKRINTSTVRSHDRDVLLPHMGHKYDRLLFYPWHQKDPRAMLRATMQATMRPTCTRVKLAELSASAAGSKLLDVGIIKNMKRGWHMPPSYKRPYIGMSRHATYKFLLNADGHVSSCRLGYIMQTNSVILKQKSRWIEYYYRSLVPGEHVLEYTTASVTKLLTKYEDPALDGELRRLANASQHFCSKFLTTDGKVRYTARALLEYTRLFEAAMPAFVRGLRGPPFDKYTAAAAAAAVSKAAAPAGGDEGGGGGRYSGGSGGASRLTVPLKEEDFERLLRKLHESSGRSSSSSSRQRSRGD